MGQSDTPRVYVDFQNADAQGRLRLNSSGTIEDLSRQHIELRQGMTLQLYSDDVNEQGGPDELRVAGRVEYSADEQTWVAVIRWDEVRHASDGGQRKAAS